MSRLFGEMTAAEHDTLERGRREADARHRPSLDLPPLGPTVNVDSHDPAVAPAEDGPGHVATCSCGWTAASSWRLAPGVTMPERYAWLEVDDHLRGHDG